MKTKKKATKAKTIRKSSDDVEGWLATLKHRRKAEVLAVRALVLRALPGVTEHVKWNAPSFCVDGDDRVTMKLQPGDVVQLVLHRGAKARAAKGFSFEDDSGLVRWVATDRGLVTISDLGRERRALATLVKRWLLATREEVL